MLGWGALAGLLLARLGGALWSTNKLIRQAEPLAPASLSVDLEALRRAAGSVVVSTGRSAPGSNHRRSAD